MARVALGLGVRELASAAEVSPDTVVNFEKSDQPGAEGRARPRQGTVEQLRAALEAAGVEFIAENGGGPGVRLRKADAA